MGPATAKKLVDAFGMETLKVIEETPHRLTEVDGIGEKKAEVIASAFQAQRIFRMLWSSFRATALPHRFR